MRFGFHRGWCRAWVQVEYGPAISASYSPIASKAPLSSYSAAPVSTGASSGNNRHNPEGGRYSSSSEQSGNESFDRRRKTTTSVEAMSGATQSLDEALLERDGAAAASPSAV